MEDKDNAFEKVCMECKKIECRFSLEICETIAEYIKAKDSRIEELEKEVESLKKSLRREGMKFKRKQKVYLYNEWTGMYIFSKLICRINKKDKTYDVGSVLRGGARLLNIPEKDISKTRTEAEKKCKKAIKVKNHRR